MKAYVGGGWAITHLTDRTVELRKDDHAYRRLTGRDGYVRVRAEPGMDRTQMLAKAMQTANETDTALAFRVANDLIPRGKALSEYRAKQRQLAGGFATPEEPELIGAKRA
jgi:hypothetical protein